MRRGQARAPPRIGLRTPVPVLRTAALPLGERRPHRSGPVPTGARRPTRWCPTTSGRSLPVKSGQEGDGGRTVRAGPHPGGGRIGRGGFRDPGDARASSAGAGERPGPGTVVGRPAVRSRRGPARLAARASPGCGSPGFAEDASPSACSSPVTPKNARKRARSLSPLTRGSRNRGRANVRELAS